MRFFTNLYIILKCGNKIEFDIQNPKIEQIATSTMDSFFERSKNLIQSKKLLIILLAMKPMAVEQSEA
jgi:hypothetical protein